ncbi:hypothetical protein OUZ56_017718 [Daphnia magna]|uniref:Uncharacterized protein n=1 Tax=Daphnia magna TaxID=35525 RepID=A0ABR0ATJ1_9CRUS|nr:hypothetical protein OUZ56_017718 [Daphnia magna]
MRTNGPAKKPKSNHRPDDELTAEREHPTFNEDEDKFKIEWMKIHLSEPGSNEATIKEHMASTYNYRQHHISQGQWTTTQILLSILASEIAIIY